MFATDAKKIHSEYWSGVIRNADVIGEEMTMPRNIARDPKKRRDYLQNLCGLPDDQVTLEETRKDGIIRKENEQL